MPLYIVRCRKHLDINEKGISIKGASSSIGNHINETGHAACFEDFYILDKTNNNFDLLSPKLWQDFECFVGVCLLIHRQIFCDAERDFADLERDFESHDSLIYHHEYVGTTLKEYFSVVRTP